MHMDEVKPAEISDLIGSLHERGYANGTRNRVLILIRHTFNLAREWQIPGAQVNPARGIGLAPEVLRERFLSEGEITTLLQALDADINQAVAKAIKLLLLTGARRNEITQAKWDDIDWDLRILLVPISKSGKPRWVRLNHEAMKVLKSIQRQDGNPFLFATPTTGRPPPSLFFPWKRIRARAGLHNVRLHDLRHSFASLLVNKRVPLYEVQRLLGHSSARTTQRYAHLADETLDDAAEVVGRTISNL